MKIGFFDSGIGGLSVLKEALRLFPEEEYIYFADSDHAPYGGRPEEEVKKLILEAIDFLGGMGIDALVLACHTASALIGEKEKDLYDFPIIGMHSGFPEWRSHHYGRKALICATDLSVKILKKKFDKNGVFADYLSLQKLVVFAEKFEFESPEVFNFLERKLAHYDWNHYHSIVLGCTHFPFFKPLIQALVPNHLRVLDGGKKTVLGMQIPPRSIYAPSQNWVKYYFSKKRKAPEFFEKYLDVLNIHQDTAVLSLPEESNL